MPFIELLEQLAQQSTRLLATLQHEKIILSQHEQPEVLLEMTENKNHQLTLLQEVENQLLLLIKPQQSLDYFIKNTVAKENPKAYPQAQKLWEKIKATLLQCQKYNTNNGNAIYTLQELNHRKLDTLLQKETRSTTYDSHGKMQRERY